MPVLDILDDNVVRALAEINNSFTNETDRGTALAGGAFIELATINLLQAFLVDNTSTRKLLKRSAAHRLQCCHALGLITDDEFSMCEQIALIRNKFAHNLQIVSFDHPEVTNLCSRLSSESFVRLEPPSGIPKSVSRRYFEAAVISVAGHMHIKRPEFFRGCRLRTMVKLGYNPGNPYVRRAKYFSPGYFEHSNYWDNLLESTSELETHLLQQTRSPGWSAADVPLYIVCQLASKLPVEFELSEYLGADFAEAARPVLKIIHRKINSVATDRDLLVDIIKRFIDHVEGGVSEESRSRGWERFVLWFNSLERAE